MFYKYSDHRRPACDSRSSLVNSTVCTCSRPASLPRNLP